jgi:hypothetical protein
MCGIRTDEKTPVFEPNAPTPLVEVFGDADTLTDD